MVSAVSVRTKINSAIIDKLGSTATRTPYVSQTVNKWGDSTVTTGTTETITIVPYSYIDKRKKFFPFGTLSEGEVVIAVKSSQTINLRDTITYDGKSFLVEEVEGFPLQNINLVNIVRLREIID